MNSPLADFGTGIVRFIRLEPQRTFYIVRLVFYIGWCVYTRAVVDPQMVLENIALILGAAVADGVARESVFRKRTTPAAVTDELGKLSMAGEVGAFAAGLLRSLVPNFVVGATLAKALEAIAPYIGPIAGQTLTPELQKEVTMRVHNALRNAGLIRRVDL